MNDLPELAQLHAVVRWIQDNTAGLPVATPGRREALTAGCFDTAIEHQAAIALLCSRGLPGSMLALLRPMIEATVRGLWLMQCASEAELERFEKGGIEKNFATIAAEVESASGARTPTLTMMKKRVWSVLHDFTHTGVQQVARRHGAGRLGPNYPATDIALSLEAAGAYGLIASAALAGMSGNADLVQRHVDRMRKYVAVTQSKPLIES
jgi:hypothetical protein